MSRILPITSFLLKSFVGIVELGPTDIAVQSSLMAPCMDMPKQGNIDQLYHEFAFLKKKHNSEMVFDPNDSDVDDAHLSKED